MMVSCPWTLLWNKKIYLFNSNMDWISIVFGITVSVVALGASVYRAVFFFDGLPPDENVENVEFTLAGTLK